MQRRHASAAPLSSATLPPLPVPLCFSPHAFPASHARVSAKRIYISTPLIFLPHHFLPCHTTTYLYQPYLLFAHFSHLPHAPAFAPLSHASSRASYYTLPASLPWLLPAGLCLCLAYPYLKLARALCATRTPSCSQPRTLPALHACHLPHSLCTTCLTCTPTHTAHSAPAGG